MKLNILLSAIVLLPIVIVVLSIWIFAKKYKKGKRTPITGNTLRSPGESLRNELEVNLDTLEVAIFRVFYVGIAPIVLLLLLMFLQNNLVPIWQLIVVFCIYIVLIVWQLKKMARQQNLWKYSGSGNLPSS